MSTNILLIDFENVQPESLELLARQNFRVLLFVGANQTRLPFETVAAMQKLGDRAEYIKIAGSSSNALDFHIAYYVGDLSSKDPSACFHILSKDTGFDPLIRHLSDKQISVCRISTMSELLSNKAGKDQSNAERALAIALKLAAPKFSKPRTIKTLSSLIGALYRKQLSNDEIAGIVRELVTQGVISVADSKVTYVPASNA